MKTLWCKNHENPNDRISHAWAPLSTVNSQHHKGGEKENTNFQDE